MLGPMNRHLSFTILAAALAACSTQSTRPTAQQASPPAREVVAAPVQAPPIATPAADTLKRLQSLAPDLDPGVLALALEARACAVKHGSPSSERLAVIDYSRPSTHKRLWVFDVRNPTLLYREYVAHGRNSGDNYARSFSNADGSLQTSLGLFRTAETYIGGNGYSLRLDGLEPGVNDAARQRAIVMHGAPYVNPALAQSQGRLGRSYGCPALRQQVAREVIDTLKNQQLLFSYYPDDAWLKRSRYFGCSGRSANEIYAAARKGSERGLASVDAVAAH